MSDLSELRRLDEIEREQALARELESHYDAKLNGITSRIRSLSNAPGLSVDMVRTILNTLACEMKKSNQFSEYDVDAIDEVAELICGGQ